MPPWLLPVFIFAVWCLWAVAAMVGRAAEDARRDLPNGQRGGVSVLPVIPVFPLAFWGAALLIDWAADPWGTRAVGSLHVLFALCLVVSIVRDFLRLRSSAKHT